MSYWKKIIIVFVATTSFINIAFSESLRSNFSGRWCGDNDSEINAFSIIIHKLSGLYIGDYGCVTMNGNKIDENDNAFSFKITKKYVVKAKIKSGITGNTGMIQLKLLNNKKIEWLILRYPDGEFYLPQKAVLHRC